MNDTHIRVGINECEFVYSAYLNLPHKPERIGWVNYINEASRDAENSALLLVFVIYTIDGVRIKIRFLSFNQTCKFSLNRFKNICKSLIVLQIQVISRDNSFRLVARLSP